MPPVPTDCPFLAHRANCSPLHQLLSTRIACFSLGATDQQSAKGDTVFRMITVPGCPQVLSPTTKETSYSERTLTFARHSKKFRRLSAQPGLRDSSDLRVRQKMTNFQLFFFSRVGLRIYKHPCTYIKHHENLIKLRLFMAAMKVL